MEEEGAECPESQVLSEGSYGELERRTDPGRGELMSKNDVNKHFVWSLNKLFCMIYYNSLKYFVPFLL